MLGYVFYFLLLASWTLPWMPRRTSPWRTPWKWTQHHLHVLYFVFQDKPILTIVTWVSELTRPTSGTSRGGHSLSNQFGCYGGLIIPNHSRKTCFYDNCDRKSVIPQKRFEFLEFKLDLYPKCGHCATIWIHALFAYQDSLRPKITKNAKKMKIFDPSCSWDIA